MRYIIDHTSFSFGIIELIALIFMLAIIFIVWRNLKKLKDEQDVLEEQASAVNAELTMDAAEQQNKNKFRNTEETTKI